MLPEVVLLAEVKSAIPAEPVRLGTPDAASAVLSKLGKAFKQIGITAQLIADRNPALSAVPADRPVLGLAVTLEPFHMANAQSGPPPARRSPWQTRPRPRTWLRSPARPGLLLPGRAADDVRSTWPPAPGCTATPTAGTRSRAKPGTPAPGDQPAAQADKSPA